MSEPSAPKNFRLQRSSSAGIGGLCAIAAALLPLANPLFFFFFSLPLLLAAFVLAIVSLVQQKIAGGIVLMISLFIALPVSIATMIAATKSRVDRASAVRQEHVDAVAAKYKTEKKTKESPEPTAASHEIAESTPAPPTLPMIISLRQSVSIQLPQGNTVLPIGTRIQIPVSATDLQ